MIFTILYFRRRNNCYHSLLTPIAAGVYADVLGDLNPAVGFDYSNLFAILNFYFLIVTRFTPL